MRIGCANAKNVGHLLCPRSSHKIYVRGKPRSDVRFQRKLVESRVIHLAERNFSFTILDDNSIPVDGATVYSSLTETVTVIGYVSYSFAINEKYNSLCTRAVSWAYKFKKNVQDRHHRAPPLDIYIV